MESPERHGTFVRVNTTVDYCCANRGGDNLSRNVPVAVNAQCAQFTQRSSQCLASACREFRFAHASDLRHVRRVHTS